MTQERMSIEALARYLPPEARVAINLRGALWYGETHPPDIDDMVWLASHGRRLPGIILDADGLVELRPKPRWRAERSAYYTYITEVGDVGRCVEVGAPSDDQRYHFGNYFNMRAQAQAYADACKALAMKLHEADE